MARTAKSPACRDNDVLDVIVVLLEASYPSTAIGPIEVFHSAGVLWNLLRGESQRPRFRVRTASIDGKTVGSLCSVGLTPECSIRDVKRADIIVLPASGMQAHIIENTPLLQWLRKWHDKGAYIAGVCTGVGFLAAAGLLDGKRATTHWAVADSMRQRFPRVNWQPEQFVTEDGRVLCSGGVYSSIDLSLYLVEKFCGHEIALQCAKSLLLSMPRRRQTGYSVLPLSRPKKFILRDLGSANSLKLVYRPLARNGCANNSSVRCGMLPTPDEPIGTGVGAFRLFATNSAAFDAGLRGFTTKIVELLTMSEIGAKSFNGSYGNVS